MLITEKAHTSIKFHKMEKIVKVTRLNNGLSKGHCIGCVRNVILTETIAFH